ncbi:twin transmembrane helix small protein [Roseivivax sp. CAU 1761]
MLQDPFFLLVAGVVLAVAVILLVGIGGFAKGGEFNRKYANKIMRLRVAAQFVAVILIVLFVLIRGIGS